MNCHSVSENNRKQKASKGKRVSHAEPAKPQRKSDRINRIYWMGDVLAQNTHRDSEAAKISKLSFAASSSLCVMLARYSHFQWLF